MSNDTVWLDRMTSPQVGEAIKNGYNTVLIAVGSTEQHGPHLPLGTDSMIGDNLMERVAMGLGKTLVAPTVRVGASEHHMAFAGSMTLREEVLEEVLVDYCHSLARHGFRTIVMIPTHGGNKATIMRAAERLTQESLSSKVIAHPDDMAYMAAMIEVGGKYDRTPGEVGSHAGHMETSLILTDYPELVDMEKAARGKVDLAYGYEDTLHEVGMHNLSPIGILGDATGSSAEAGEDYAHCMLDAMVEQLREIVSSSDK
jgi:creatinine amidohydrolase